VHFIDPAKHTRRAFLRRAGQLAFTGTALPTALNLAALGEAAAFNATDYKALVCVFLFGGNDYANTVVNYDSASHAQYATIRGGIAIPRADLAATVRGPRVHALHFANAVGMALQRPAGDGSATVAGDEDRGAVVGHLLDGQMMAMLGRRQLEQDRVQLGNERADLVLQRGLDGNCNAG